jgi:hypothetical protein
MGSSPLGEGGLEGVAVDAELAGSLPHPDLAGQGINGLASSRCCREVVGSDPGGRTGSGPG